MLSKRLSRLLTVGVFALVLTTGCASQRVGQFRSFAAVGDAYVDALGPLLDEAGEAAIDNDSLILLSTRASTDAAERARTLQSHNEALSRRIGLLGAIRRHALLLQGYFAALAALADADADTRISAALDSSLDRLATIRGTLRSAPEISVLAKPVTRIAVGNFKKRALDQELRARAQVIAEDIDLQRAALQAISETLRADLEQMTNLRERKQVVEPFVGTGSVSESEWATARRRALTQRAAARSAEAAAAAADALKQSYVALAENRLDAVQLDTVLNHINQILDLLEELESAS